MAKFMKLMRNKDYNGYDVLFMVSESDVKFYESDENVTIISEGHFTKKSHAVEGKFAKSIGYFETLNGRKFHAFDDYSLSRVA